MKFQEGTLRHLQEYCAQRTQERGFNDETTEERLILLVEEVGELMKAYRRQSGMHLNQADDAEANVGEEIADVLIVAIAVANSLGINLEEAFVLKEAKVDTRIYSRRRTK